jgi:hypothetical protein
MRLKKLWRTKKFKDAMSARVFPKGKWADADRRYLQYFKGMHDRVRDGKAPSISWPRTMVGLEDFKNEIGEKPPKPASTDRWSVGRRDHKKGYEVGNVFWQLQTENSGDRS